MSSTKKAKVDTEPKGDDESYLPRGGSNKGGLRSPGARRPAQNDGEGDLFQRGGSEGKRKVRKPTKKSKNDSDSLDSGISDSDSDEFTGTAAEAPSRIDLLRYSILHEGMQFLACIKEINEFDLVVSLPNNLKGFIKATEISDNLTKLVEAELAAAKANVDDDEESSLPKLHDLVYIGQYVRCVIIKLDESQSTNKRIYLSMRESLLNLKLNSRNINAGQVLSGSISSVEDHGYVVSLGLKDAKGFLLKKNAKNTRPATAAGGSDAALQIGQPVDFIVTGVNKESKTVFLDANRDKIINAAIKSEDIVGIENLRPGMTLKVSVESTLPNGIFVRFLEYFTGTIDVFHLGKPVPQNKLATTFTQGQKLRACIVVVDLENKAISLTLQPHVLSFTPFDPEQNGNGVQIGEIFETAEVSRIDPGIGIALTIPAKTGPLQAYAHISRLSDKEVDKIEKKFDIGDKVRCRVVGFSYLDGLANVTLKKSQIEEPLMRYEDIKVGEVVNGTISHVHKRGMEIKITKSIKAFCPLSHLADVIPSDPESRFKVGAQVSCRVLSADPKRRQVVVTHKKSLVKSELPLIADWNKIVVDSFSHGYIVAVKDFGCIVGFYGDVKGKVAKSELSNHFVENPKALFKVGQVMKCRVVNVDPIRRKLNVSFNMVKPPSEVEKERIRVEYEEFAQNNLFVSGTVTSVSSRGVEIKIADTELKGFIPIDHLSDHLQHCEGLKKKISVGDTLEDVLVLKASPRQLKLTLSNKPSLRAAAKAGKLPRLLSELNKGEVYHGYVKKLAPYGVFVCFGNGLSGLCPKSHLADHFVQEVEKVYVPGQSISAYIVDINEAKNEFNVSMKQSLCGSQDSAWLSTYFAEEKTIRKVKTSIDWSKYTIGKVIDMTITKIEQYGYILAVQEKLSAFAHIKQTQGVDASEGSLVKGVILDIDYSGGIMDVSLRPELVAAASAASSGPALRAGNAINNAMIELVKANYIIISFPRSAEKGQQKGLALAYAPTRDYNTVVYAQPFAAYQPLQKVKVTIQVAPKQATPKKGAVAEPAERTLVSIAGSSATGKHELEFRNDNINTLEDVKIGMAVKCKIVAIKDSQLNVSVGLHVKGRIHITEVFDDMPSGREHPFSKFTVGQILEDCRVISISSKESNRYLPITHQTMPKMAIVDLSLRPSTLSLAPPAIGNQRHDWNTMKKGQVLNGWVHQVTADGLWIHISPYVRGRVFILDTSNNVEILRNLADHFKPGQGVKCKVLRIDAEKQDLDLSIKALYKEPNTAATPQELKAGMIVPGRIARVILNAGLNVQLFSHTYGRVFITDISDDMKENPLEEFATKEGEIVEAYVLAVNERQDNLIDLSIRASRLGNNATPKFTELKDFKSVIPGAIVRGYVKVVNTKNKTAFVSINRNLVARVFFNNLSDTFVKDPVHKFPIGKMVEGRILSVDPKEKHIEMTLKKREVSGKKISFDELEINAKVKGWVKRIEKFGIFITIKRAGIVGLCHLSELSDEKPMTEEEAKKIFSVGDYVKAVILRKNPEKKQVSLSMKPSHFENEEESDDSSDEEKNEIGDDDGEIGDELVSSRKKRKSASNEDDAATPPQKKKKSKEIVPDSESSDDEMAVANDDDSDDDKVVSEDEDDDDAMDVDEESDTPLAKIGKIDFGAKSVLSAPARAANTNAATKSKSADKAKAQQDILVNDEDSEDDLAELASLDSDDEEDKKKPGKGKAAEPEKTKKSAKAEELDELAKERAIEARERAVLEQRPPETPADFERLLVSSPNSSTIWIRFMAFYLFTNELPKAREVAEKALKKIDIREQNEKKNVWVAYMNMENTYGTKESLAAVFRRAVSHSDPENMHLELIKIYTRADNMKAADELYMQLARKWKSSMSVWVRYGIFKFTQGKSDEARLLLDKALKVLPKRDHLSIISKFAQLEFKFGAPERGRTIFENILSSYPKRVDIWSIYLDMEQSKTGDIDKIRSIFERVITLNLSSKKMKYFFQRYLKFEKENGTPETVDHVREAAQNYVERKTSVTL